MASSLAAAIKEDPAIAGATRVMLPSASQSGDAARSRELGVAAYLTKPIKRAELLSAILQALGRQTSADRPTLITEHVLRDAHPTARILLVEDNRVNQLLARRLLAKRGHTVVVTGSGREALAALDAACDGFDCVLMDVQMPEMDGFECTALIREREETTGMRLPIIAMTAHAMKGDEARCLAAGMDAYLSKPVQPDELYECLERQLERNSKSGIRNSKLGIRNANEFPIQDSQFLIRFLEVDRRAELDEARLQHRGRTSHCPFGLCREINERRVVGQDRCVQTL